MQVAELPRSVTDTKSPTTQYDAVIVSTSPVCLMTALALRAQGKRVLLVDQSPIIGGAWITTDIGGFSNVEVGCHLIDPDPAVYGFMKGLGIAMQPLSPRPEILSRGPARFPQRIPYSHRWLRDLYDIIARPEPSAFVTLPRAQREGHPEARLPRLPPRLQGGQGRHTRHPLSQGWLLRDRRAPGRAGGDLRRRSPHLDSPHRGLDGPPDRRCVHAPQRRAGDGRARLHARERKLCLTSETAPSRVVALDANKHIFQNLYLVLRDTGPINLTYTLLYGDKLVHRVRPTRFAIASLAGRWHGDPGPHGG